MNTIDEGEKAEMAASSTAQGKLGHVIHEGGDSPTARFRNIVNMTVKSSVVQTSSAMPLEFSAFRRTVWPYLDTKGRGRLLEDEFEEHMSTVPTASNRVSTFAVMRVFSVLTNSRNRTV